MSNFTQAEIEDALEEVKGLCGYCGGRGYFEEKSFNPYGSMMATETYYETCDMCHVAAIEHLDKKRLQGDMQSYVASYGRITMDGRERTIFDVLCERYYVHHENAAMVNNRLVRFDNVGFMYVDSIPANLKEGIIKNFDQDLKRMQEATEDSI